MTAADLVRDLYAAAGSREFTELWARVAAGGEEVADVLFASLEDDGDYPPASPDAHPRDVWEDRTAISVGAAQQWPERFMRLVQHHPEWTHDPSIDLILALGWVDRSDARDLLVDAVQRRAAGHEYHRAFALEGLSRLADPRLPDLLLRLIKDRSSSVRSCAISVAIDCGDARLLPALRGIAAASRTPPGTRAAAYDAIEAIVTRAGLTDEPLGPRGRQLIEIRRPDASEVTVESVHVYEGQDVTVDDELARLQVEGQPLVVKAPHGGVIVSIGVVPGWPPRPVMFRLRSWMVL